MNVLEPNCKTTTMDSNDSPPSSSNDATDSKITFAQQIPQRMAQENEQENHRFRPRWQMRPDDDDEPQDWWFCSTAIPLLAATSGPLANVLSIAALVTSWRNNYDPANPGVDSDSIGYPDPHWCLGLNGASLACGFAGNLFLLFNFTRKVRYIVALPATIILWYFATGIVGRNFFVPSLPAIYFCSLSFHITATPSTQDTPRSAVSFLPAPHV